MTSEPATARDVELTQALTPDQVRCVSGRHLHLDKLVTVVGGQASAFDWALCELGPVTRLAVDPMRR